MVGANVIYYSTGFRLHHLQQAYFICSLPAVLKDKSWVKKIYNASCVFLSDFIKQPAGEVNRADTGKENQEEDGTSIHVCSG